MVAIPLDRRKQDLGIVPPELPELEAVGYRAAKHFVPPVGCLRGSRRLLRISRLRKGRHFQVHLGSIHRQARFQ